MTGNPLNCSLVFQTYGMFLSVLVDYGDGSGESFSGVNSTAPILIKKAYAVPGIFSIIFQGSYNNTVLNYTVNVQGSKMPFYLYFHAINLNNLIFFYKGAKCLDPVLSIINIGTLNSPYQVNRSDQFSVVAQTFYPCTANLTSDVRSWSVYSTTDLTKSKDLASGNPTKSSNEMSFSGNVLSYGTYMFIYTATYTYQDIVLGSTSHSASITGYVQVIPSGIAVFGFPSGVQQMLFGCTQPIAINPGSNSIDFDNLANLASLNFNFYCRRVNESDKSTFDPSQYTSVTSLGTTNNMWQVNDNNMTCLFGNLIIFSSFL